MDLARSRERSRHRTTSRPSRPPKIVSRILLIPSASIDLFGQGVDLVKLVRYLNRNLESSALRHRVKFFVVVDGNIEHRTGKQSLYRAKALQIRQKIPFKTFRVTRNSPVTSDVFSAAREACIVDIDAFTQLKEEACKAMMNKEIVEFGLVIGLGSEVVRDDREDAEYTGIKEEDAYSCTAWVKSFETTDNDVYDPLRNISFISLARAYCKDVFRLDLSDIGTKPHEKRAIISRFIVANIAYALSGNLFRRPLPRDHSELCVAETCWHGGERESYAATGLCSACQRLAKETGLTERYVPLLHDFKSAVIAIEQVAMAALSDPLISNDRKKPTERPALRYGLGEPGHERR